MTDITIWVYGIMELMQSRNTFAAKHLKNRYLSAKHVSKTPEYWGYIGSTQSISRTIRPITVKLSQNVANILLKIIKGPRLLERENN